MGWSLPWSRKVAAPSTLAADACVEPGDVWQQHVSRLAAHGIAEPGSVLGNGKRNPATHADAAALYEVAPSFVGLLPWVEYWRALPHWKPQP